MLEDAKRSPISLKVLATGSGDGDKESYDPKDDDPNSGPANHVELGSPEKPAIKKADRKLQEPKGYRMDQVESSL